jgi:hypothetical protein
MGWVSRPWFAIVAGGALLVVIAAVALRLQVTIPSDPAAVPIARAILAGPVGPYPTDQPFPTDGSDPDPQVNASSPYGQACLDRMTSGSGWLDLCWEAYRFGRDADPKKDYYLLRLYGSHQGFRWLVVRSELIGTPGDNVYDVWPDGTYEGACGKEPVNLLVPLAALGEDDVCGRTEAHLGAGHWSHALTWTCEDCLFANSDTRGIAMYAVVGMPEGSIPTWDLFADAGS